MMMMNGVLLTLLDCLCTRAWGFQTIVPFWTTTTQFRRPSLLQASELQPPSTGSNNPLINDKQQQNDKKQEEEFSLPDFLMERRESGFAAAAILASPILFDQIMKNDGLEKTSLMSALSNNKKNANPISSQTLASLEKGDEIVRSLWLGRLAYPTLIVSLEMGVFEALQDGPLSMERLGSKLEPQLAAHSRTLQGMISVLLSLQLLERVDNNDNDKEATTMTVQLSDAARMVLVKDSPYYWGSQLLASDGLTATLRRRIVLESHNKNKNNNDNNNVIQHQDHSNQMIDSFTASMQSHSAVTAEATAMALQHYFVGMNDAEESSSSFLNDHSHHHLLDMAGGSGCFSTALAQRVPNLHITLADLPRVVATWRHFNKQGLMNGNNAPFFGRRQEEQIRAVPADLFVASTWPTTRDKDATMLPVDSILLANVLHDWGPKESSIILQNAYRTLPKGGRVFVIEQLLHNDKVGPLPASLASISMLLGDWRTGKQYTLTELTDMAQKAGFSNVQLGPACGSFHHAVICTK